MVVKTNKPDDFDALRLMALQAWNVVCKSKSEKRMLNDKIQELTEKRAEYSLNISKNEKIFHDLSMRAFGINNK